MTDDHEPTIIEPDYGRFAFWLAKHPGKRPPDHIIPESQKATYQEWDEFEAAMKAKREQLELFEGVD